MARPARIWQTRVSSFGLMCIYDGANGGEAPEHWTHWGRHYEEYERCLLYTSPSPRDAHES
eukprot:2137977-Prymnesium_polylepis.1